jgi:hypothetical protein
MSKEEIYNEIDVCVNLEHNWDGYGAIPLLEDIGYQTKTFISHLNDNQINHIDDIYPNPHGTIDIVWKNNFDDYEKIVLEIGLNGYTYFILSTDHTYNGVNGENKIMLDIDKIKIAIDGFIF